MSGHTAVFQLLLEKDVKRTAERTGSPVLHTLWSYILNIVGEEIMHYCLVQMSGGSADLASHDWGDEKGECAIYRVRMG
ncbi:hypothetical protein N7510_011581 [Penicillium lagena]|nr:hypothetical protein N7510_011581 [Penicillium lagena]